MSTTLADRAKGTAFEVIYQPRATPDSAQPAKKSGPKPSGRKAHAAWSGLKPLDNVAPNFNTPITTREQAARTSRIRGRGLK